MQPVLPLTHPLTLFHVVLSLVAIVVGLVVAKGLLSSERMPRWTHVFLWTTVATTLTGFVFPFRGFTPAIGTGIISMIVLALAIVALRVKHLNGPWRRAYVISAVVAQYFNVFVLIVQSFQRVPFLNALAPTQTEAPFAIAQLAALAGFVILGYAAARGFVRAVPRVAVVRGSQA